MRRADDLLTNRGIPVELDLTPTFIGDRSNLLGYFSWGSNDARYSYAKLIKQLFFAAQISGGHHRVSLLPRSFMPTEGGQSLLVDLITPTDLPEKLCRTNSLLQANASPTIVMDSIHFRIHHGGKLLCRLPFYRLRMWLSVTRSAVRISES